MPDQAFIALAVCPFYGWPKRQPPAPQDDVARGKDLQMILAEHGAKAFTDDLWDHINLDHIREDGEHRSPPGTP